MGVRFGECVVDSATRQLLVRGEVVHLPHKAFSFSSCSGRTVSRRYPMTSSMSASDPARSFRIEDVLVSRRQARILIDETGTRLPPFGPSQNRTPTLTRKVRGS